MSLTLESHWTGSTTYRGSRPLLRPRPLHEASRSPAQARQPTKPAGPLGMPQQAHPSTNGCWPGRIQNSLMYQDSADRPETRRRNT